MVKKTALADDDDENARILREMQMELWTDDPLTAADIVAQYFRTPTKQGLTIQEQFEEFHRLNPRVYELLERFTAEMVARGRERIGIRMLWERVRWEVLITTSDPTSEYKINDHYHSRYVRLLIESHPEWAGLFELRELRAP